MLESAARGKIPAGERTRDPSAARPERVTARVWKRILLATFGSLGDLHPYVAIALGLRERGHLPIIATSAAYRQTVEGFGLGFHPVRPDIPDPSEMPDKVRRVMDRRRSTEVVLQEWIMPALRDSADGTSLASIVASG
ncbi:MAG: glycosyltransferase [Chloroflexi bacterium]|nr:glycosyltransferase [Chloroflexota bacterium]